MSIPIGKHAVVVGAGMGGLTAARALADSFERVTVLDSDALPPQADHRPGTPQSRHAHALLAAGQQSLSSLFPGFEQDLTRAGAVLLRVSSDFYLERLGYDPFPQRDLGFPVFSISRPLLEFTVRQRLAGQRNVILRGGCRAQEFVATPDATAIAAVLVEHRDARSETLPADFVVDSTGHGNLTVSFLASIGQPPPPETSIGIDMSYATAVFDVPKDAPLGWKCALTLPDPPRNRRAGFILPSEGHRWVVTLGGRHGVKPPDDWDGFLAYAQQLRTPTVYNAIRRAKPLGEIARFGLKASSWKHFELLANFPRGLLPFGDAICRFNPVYGQGMSVAAQEACVLRRLLAAHAAGLADLASLFFAEVKPVIETPWTTAAIPDFLDPQTQGQRPPDLEKTLKFSAALFKLAAQDPAVHKLMTEVQHLLKPQSAYRDPELVRRVEAVMAASAQPRSSGATH